MMFIKTGFCCHANRLLLHKRLEFRGKETQKIRVTINYAFIFVFCAFKSSILCGYGYGNGYGYGYRYEDLLCVY